jgi:hypothetical protein
MNDNTNNNTSTTNLQSTTSRNYTKQPHVALHTAGSTDVNVQNIELGE